MRRWWRSLSSVASRSRRVFAPLALVVGGFVMFFSGLKLLFSNWRLTLVQALPAMWIWLAMYDFKAHVLHGKSFHVLRGPVLVLVVLVIAAITAASFFLNAVFGFAIVQAATPKVRPACRAGPVSSRVILGSGAVVGLLLGLSTMVVTRWGRPWFAIWVSVVIGVMMVCYVAVPARLIGVKRTTSRRDKLTASAVGGALGAVVCAPPYVLGRMGILMLGSPKLFVPGHRGRERRDGAASRRHGRGQDRQEERQATRASFPTINRPSRSRRPGTVRRRPRASAGADRSVGQPAGRSSHLMTA